MLTQNILNAQRGEQKWALLYLMEWAESQCLDPSFVRGGMAIFPQVHGFYDTEQEATEAKFSKTNPSQYHVRAMRNYSGSGI